MMPNMTKETDVVKESLLNRYHDKLRELVGWCMTRDKLNIRDAKFNSLIVNIYDLDLTSNTDNLYFRLPIGLMFKTDPARLLICSCLNLKAYGLPIEIAEKDESIDIWCKEYADRRQTWIDIDKQLEPKVIQANKNLMKLKKQSDREDYIESTCLQLENEAKYRAY